CSKGTYVRTLAEDIARALGTCGHVSLLRRLHVEPFEGEPMVTLEAVMAAAEAGQRPPLLDADRGGPHLPGAPPTVAAGPGGWPWRRSSGSCMAKLLPWQWKSLRDGCVSTTRTGGFSASASPMASGRCSRGGCSWKVRARKMIPGAEKPCIGSCGRQGARVE